MALFHLSATGWTHDPSHHMYLQSTLFLSLGDEDRALDALRLTLRLTPPDSHDYLTTAPIYWSLSSTRKALRDAERFLVELARTCPPGDVDEVAALTRTHFALAPRQARRKPRLAR